MMYQPITETDLKTQSPDSGVFVALSKAYPDNIDIKLLTDNAWWYLSAEARAYDWLTTPVDNYFGSFVAPVITGYGVFKVNQDRHVETIYPDTFPTYRKAENWRKNWEFEQSQVAVIFRVWTAEFPGTRKVGTGNLYNTIALFPELPADVNGHYCESYQHVGQHGAANYQMIIAHSRPAWASEYADLKRELESAPYHYNFVVYKRQTPQHRAKFAAEVKRLRSL